MQRLGKSLVSLTQALSLRVEASSGVAAARWSSTAASAAAGAAEETAKFTGLQGVKRALRPQDSGRNAFRRGWTKQLRIKWAAQERRANQAFARARKHEQLQQRIQQRSEWAEAVAA